MSETETARSPLELEEADAYSQYLLHSPTEVAFVLRNAMQKGCMMTVYFDMGQSFFLTSLLQVTPKGIVLDYGSDEDTNRRALKAGRLICTTSVDKVKVQFALDSLSLVNHEGSPAFFSPLPANLLRLQRREYFRVSTPIANPLKCEIQVSTETGGITAQQIPLLDISAGGMGLMAAVDQAQYFGRGSVFRNCVLTLPDDGPIKVDLEVRNLFEVTTRNGSRYFRVGCEFLDLPGLLLTMIQRYITRLERERKARISGLE
ncbi:flagellar brake protein [Azovibrio restrictus]|uniref:flagellar brake protein n=1 Tax=Azovibrio restrictus TaxID=146938 RepID=UPI0003FA1E38|nr:flagellar brake protein [Azovibrio restrictus]MCE1170014.1 flagellar brake protein [Azovibrio sp.]